MASIAAYGKFSIYALKDPVTNRVFYIGRSKHPSTRILQHVSEAQNYKASQQITEDQLFGLEKFLKRGTGSLKKMKWINNIIEKGLQPELIILDEWDCFDVADANRLEDAWIAEMKRRGEPLTNRILSRRMKPEWYITSPTQYMEWLKAGKPKHGVSVDVSKSPQSDETPTTYKKKIYKRKQSKRKKASNWGRSTQFSKPR